MGIVTFFFVAAATVYTIAALHSAFIQARDCDRIYRRVCHFMELAYLRKHGATAKYRPPVYTLVLRPIVPMMAFAAFFLYGIGFMWIDMIRLSEKECHAKYFRPLPDERVDEIACIALKD